MKPDLPCEFGFGVGFGATTCAFGQKAITVLDWRMTADIFQALILSFSTVVAAVLGIPRFFKDARSNVLVDLEIYQGLPSGSAAKEQLLARIEEQLSGLDHKRDARRDPVGITLAVMFLGLAIWMAVLINQSGGTWLLLSPLVAGLFLLGGVGLAQDGRKHVRDAKGRPVR